MMMRLSMSNTKNFLENTLDALQTRWSSSKSEGRNSRTLEKETFFEKFGTVFKQRSTHFLLQSKNDVTLQDESDATQELIVNNAKPQINPSAVIISNGVQNFSPVDFSIDVQYDEDALGDLYEKVLFEIINGNIQEVTEKILFSYAQDVFKMNEKTHEEILKRAQFKPMSEAYLRVELVEAKLNERSSVEGALNPFVVMYLQTDLLNKERSTIRKETHNPVWKECFTIPTVEKSQENLIVEVFHYNYNINKVQKTIRICKKYAYSCLRPKASYQKLIGRASIAIETITSSGLVTWCTLSKSKRTDPQGTVKLRFHFSSGKDKDKSRRDHEMLTKMFLEYELNSSSVARYWWSGKFTSPGEAILKQHAICADLSDSEKVLIYWNAYTTVHITYPIAFSLFESLLNKICASVSNNLIEKDDLKRFWLGVKKILPSCFAVIIKLRKRIAGDNDIVKTVTSVLNILAKLEGIRSNCDIDLFSPDEYEYLKHKIEQNPKLPIPEVTLLAVRTGARNWFDQIMKDTMKANLSNEEKLQHSIKMIQLLLSDIKRSSTYYNIKFKSIMKIDYTREICKQHEASLVTHIKHIVETICKGFKKLTIRMDQHNRFGEMNALDMSTTLFHLYIVIRLFLEETDKELKSAHNSDIVNFHEWFSNGIIHWCDVFALKALSSLSHAIDNDKLEPETGIEPKQSSSAAKFLAIVREMENFWEELAWPDPNTLNRFLKRSIGDICSCCIYYADRISTKLHHPENNRKHADLPATLDLMRKCALVNSNLSILIDVLTSLPDVLGYQQVDLNANEASEQMLPIKGLSSWKTKTLNLLTDHCMSAIKISMRDSLVKFDPIRRDVENFTAQSAAVIREDLHGDDMKLVENSLWSQLTAEFEKTMNTLIGTKTPIQTFSNLKDFYETIPESQQLQNDIELREKLFSLEKQMRLYSSSTRDLIHHYYLACMDAQALLDEPDRGILTVRCCIRNDNLEIQIISAESIKLPPDYKGNCDSYVKINLVPGYKYSNLQMPKTRSKSKNHSPTYNEKFTLKLSQEQREIPDALIAFNLKVSEMLGLTQRHVGECFVRLDSIPVISSEREIQSIEVQQLFITLPENIGSDCIPVLEYRQSDKEAVQFFKKLKQKLGRAAYTGSVLSIY
ncbi:protein unc-13 homolog 4B-like [Ochlerotatus camptorhynchus]|uniref:protein unc-13 homolog 4B-like n=1 Tax=Ochlerotatus camptorhynchus TaxID=644619 RepID=UPI0031DC606B